MKIVCQSCSATYKIADDKVQGKKVFKIKCKKCGEDILVRGTDAQAPVEQALVARPAEDESTRAMASAADAQGTEAIWHAVINGDQHGPYAIDQFRDLLAQGNLDAETYVWRDGFEGWLPMHEVVELAWMLTPAAPEAAAPAHASYAPQAYSVPAPAAAPEPAHHEPEADLFGGSTVAMQSPVIPPAGSDLFAPIAPPVAAAPVAAAPASISSAPAKTRPSAKSLSGDLFAAEARAQEAARPLVPDAVPEPQESSASSGASGGGGVTGTRNENSVLFSLATLQQLSGGPANGSAPAPGSANSDSSGLIDINKLAGALNNAPGSRRAAVDDILSVGTSGLGSPLSAPMLMPVAVPAPAVSPALMEPHEPQGVNKTWLFTGIAVAGILVAGGLGAAWIVRGRPAEAPATASNVALNSPAPAANPPGGANAVAAAPPVAAPTPAPIAPAAQPEGTAPAPAGTAPAPTAAAAAPAAVHERPRERPSHASTGDAPPALAHMPSPSPAPAAIAAPSRPASHGGGGGSLEDLMGQVAGGGGSHPAPRPAAASNSGGGGGGDLPATPSRTDVISAMHDVQPSVRSCGAGQGGMAMVTVVFAGSGRVTTATVASPFGGTPVGTCVARAVRSAHLPSFSNQTFNVTYPFPLQ